MDFKTELQKGLADSFNADNYDEPIGFQGPGVVYGDVPPKMKSSEYLQAATGWVYAAVSAIADAVIKLKLRMYKVAPNGDITEVTEHPALDLLYRVNPYMTFVDHIWLTQQYLELTGEAPWFIDRGESGKQEPQNIILLQPDKLFIKKSDNKESLDVVTGYEYRLNSTTNIQIKPDELLFLKYPDPTNSFRGKGTLQAAAKVVDIDNFSEDYNRSFFYNGARPDSTFTTPNKLTKAQRDVLRADISRLHKGTKNAHKVAILESGLKWEAMSVSGKDMEFMEQQRFSRDKILAIFRVPKSIVSVTEDVNLANAKVGEYVFAKWTIKPKLERLVAQLNEFFLPMFKGTDKMFLSFDDPVPSDTADIVQRFTAALNLGYMTRNEVRAELNLPDVGPEGDKLLIPNSIRPIEDAGATNPIPFGLSVEAGHAKNRYKGIIERSVNGYYRAMRVTKAVETAKKAIKKVESKVDQIVANEIKTVVKQRKDKVDKIKKEWENSKDIFVKATVSRFDRYEAYVKKTQLLIFKMQAKKIDDKFNKKSKAKSINTDKYLLDEEDETQIMVRIYDPILRQIITEQGRQASKLVTGKAAFSIATEPVQQYLQNRSYDFSIGVNQETNRLLGEALAEGVAAGEGIPELRTRVAGVFEGMADYRAERIARSEVIRASGFATHEAYDQSGVVEAQEWLATEDDKTCQWCIEMENKFGPGTGGIPISDSFFNKGDTFKGKDGGILNLDYSDIEYPPLHTSCRCTLIAVIK